MKARILNLGLSLLFCIGTTACNKEEFFEKEFLETPTAVEPKGSGEAGNQGGTDGVGDTQGGVDSGVDGGTVGGSTTGSTTGGVDGATVGGTTGGTYGDCNNGHGNDADGIDESNPTIGTEPKCKVETFRQAAEESKKIDIVWVIDNSGSMNDEQSSLGINFSAFIDDFIDKNVDFRMAITTTDTSTIDKKGKMIAGSDFKLNSQAAKVNEAQFKADFKSMIKVGTNGSGSEKGLAASEGFMDKYAATFVRPSAYLAVVVVSDEEDQSSKTVQQYTDYLKSFKNSNGLVKVYSVVDVNNTNCCQQGIATGSARYKAASNNTAGMIADIREDFHGVLNDMGESIINLLDSFALSHEPVQGTLKVFVNSGETINYTYDSASRSIKFNQNSIPPVGAEIKVYYVK